MNPCDALIDSSYFLPSAYLASDPLKIHFQLLVTVAMPPFTKLCKQHEELVESVGAVRYDVADAPEGCDREWVFQEVISFVIEEGVPIDDRQIGIEVLQLNGSKGNVIVHHADADEAGTFPPAS